MRWISICLITFVSFTSVVRAQDSEGIPAYKITPVESRIKFGVKESVPIAATFDKRNATREFTSINASAGLLCIDIQADSVTTGRAMKNCKLKGKEYYAV